MSGGNGRIDCVGGSEGDVGKSVMTLATVEQALRTHARQHLEQLGDEARSTLLVINRQRGSLSPVMP